MKKSLELETNDAMQKVRRNCVTMVSTIVITITCVMCLPAAAQVSQEALDSISTPDQVETSIGTLEFFDGIPTRDTARLLYDNLDFLRGVETNGTKISPSYWERLGKAGLGGTVKSLNTTHHPRSHLDAC